MTRWGDNHAPPPGSLAGAALERVAVPSSPGEVSRPNAGEADLPALAELLDACAGEHAGDTLRWLRFVQHVERVRHGTEASRGWLTHA
jgi:hypothetical protein